MSRIGFGLPAIAALTLLGAGCSSKPKPAPSAFARDNDAPQMFAAIAKQAGVTQQGFNFGGTTNSFDGKSNWDVKLRYCARPDQIDEAMRIMHAEIAKKLRESGAEPRGEAPPAGPAAVQGWQLAYTAGTQEGTIRVTRNDGKAGECRDKGLIEYQVEFVLDEAPKPAK